MDKQDRRAMEGMLARARHYKFFETESDQGVEFVQRIEDAIGKLPACEKELITERYMNLDADYIKDYEIYQDVMHISETTYSEIRNRALENLAATLGLKVQIEHRSKSDVLTDADEFSLPDIRKPVYDVERTIAAVEDVFERYRYFKFVEFEEIESKIKVAYEDRPSGRTNATSDSTASIAVHNADQAELRRTFIAKIDRAVQRLPQEQRKLIELKYMQDELESHFKVYVELGISKMLYQKLRWRAVEKLAGILGLEGGTEK